MPEKLHNSADGPDEKSDLRYLDASRVQSPMGDLRSIQVLGSGDERLGHVDGVLIDPAERRLRFYVVASDSGTRRHYLVPSDLPARIDPVRRLLHFDVEPRQLSCCQEFTRAQARDFTDDDMLAAIFSRRSA